jgi:hypothetical protein
MILACVNADRPQRALAYRRTMAAQRILADDVTIGLSASAFVALGQPLNALADARRALELGELLTLSVQCCARLLAACAAASETEADAPAARAAMLWTMRRMLDAGGGGERDMTPAAASGAHGSAAAAVAEHGAHSAYGYSGSEAATPAVVLATAEAPWARRPRCVVHILRTLGNARDFGAARLVFELVPLPRPPAVWSEMLRVCNLCGEPAFASRLLAEAGGGASRAPL